MKANTLKRSQSFTEAFGGVKYLDPIFRLLEENLSY